MNRVAVIGCGPAGIAAAVQLVREGHPPLVFEGKRPGGLLRNANLVENYPGCPGGISGPELVERMLAQLEEHSVEVRREEVLELVCDEKSFSLRTGSGVYAALRVVLAPGTRPRVLTVPDDCRGRVFSEVAEMGDVSGKRVAIIGAGDAAFDYALNLGREN